MQTTFNLKEAAQDLKEPKRDLETFLAALFRPTDLVELRAITSPVERRPGRVLRQFWRTPADLLAQHHELHTLNQRANLFFGVNPRRDASGIKTSVAVTRCVWADLDHMTHEDAAKRWRPILPKPSIVVNSGSGIHLYWLLDHNHAVEDARARTAFESTLKSLYGDLGADSVQDVSRVLRLPGFLNRKHGPVPCELLRCDPKLRYSFSTFARWINATPPEAPLPSRHSLPTYPDGNRVRRLLCYLDRKVDDRSRRDFGVIARLVELGLSRDEIWRLVQDKSKFATHGESYYQITFDNVLKSTGQNNGRTNQ